MENYTLYAGNGVEREVMYLVKSDHPDWCRRPGLITSTEKLNSLHKAEDFLTDPAEMKKMVSY